MMYLSRLVMDIRNPGAKQCLRDCQDMHRTLMKGFTSVLGHEARRESGLLYRLQLGGQRPKIYVLSANPPDWLPLVEYGFQSEGVKDISSLPEVIRMGMRLSFDLVAIPSRKVGCQEQKNSRRVLLRTEQERTEWLARQAERHGFIIEWVREEGQVKAWGNHDTDNGGTMFHTGVRFRGVLRITNVSAFIEAYRTGFGPAKAYGFGLMMIGRTS